MPESDSIKLIEKCQNHSNKFWKCIDYHKNMKNMTMFCGNHFYNMMRCIEKLK